MSLKSLATAQLPPLLFEEKETITWILKTFNFKLHAMELMILHERLTPEELISLSENITHRQNIWRLTDLHDWEANIHILNIYEQIYIRSLKRSREGGGFVSKHLGNPLGDPDYPLLSTGRSDSLIS